MTGVQNPVRFYIMEISMHADAYNLSDVCRSLSKMESVLEGIHNHQVVLMRRGDIQGLFEECKKSKRSMDVFFQDTPDLRRASIVLSEKPYLGQPSIVIFIHCGSWIKHISGMIRNRPANQAVVLITNGKYTTGTPLMESLADRYVGDF